MLALIEITPDPILFRIGPLAIGWYGIAYIAAIAAMLLVSQRELERRGIAGRHFVNAMLFVGALALIGGRLYHVIHEWDVYRDDLLRVVLPPYAGLGLYGGIAGAALGILIYGRWNRLPIRLGLDAIIPGTFFAQAIARWGNFFNQELFGPPTDAPWAIAIQCAYRVGTPWPCPPGSDPAAVLGPGFHPLFFYESALNLAGGLIALWLSRRHLDRLRPGDLAAFWGIWYGSTRAFLETFREGYNWTLEGVPTAQLIGFGLIAVGVAWIAWNHRPRADRSRRSDVVAEASPYVGVTSDRVPVRRADARRDSRLIGRASPRPGLLYRFFRWYFGLVGPLLFRIEISGLEHLPRTADGRPAGGWIACGVPHRTWVEPFVLLFTLPAQPRLVMLGEGATIFASRWRAFLLRRVGGVIPVWRGPGARRFAEMASAVDAATTSGAVVAIFPEAGPPSRPPALRRLSPGVAHLARAARAPVVPIVFGGTHDVYLRRRIVVRMLPALSPPAPDAVREALERFMDDLRARAQQAADDAHVRAESGAPLRRRWRWLHGPFPRPG
ncbi:MAG: prolipoprotein diacylglyceryl transferase [Chloroflexota bacterium]|nr:prolipoprotein diacylglyceryl transferase [Chloroflexota bacterium]